MANNIQYPIRLCGLGQHPFTNWESFKTIEDARKYANTHYNFWKIWEWTCNWNCIEEINNP